MPRTADDKVLAPPDSPDGRSTDALPRLNTARAAKAVDFTGALVYSDNNTIEPWVIAQEALLAEEGRVAFEGEYGGELPANRGYWETGQSSAWTFES